MLDNGAFAELLTQEAEQAEGRWKFALKRAVNFAFLWPQEAAELVSEENGPTIRRAGLEGFQTRDRAFGQLFEGC